MFTGDVPPRALVPPFDYPECLNPEDHQSRIVPVSRPLRAPSCAALPPLIGNVSLENRWHTRDRYPWVLSTPEEA